MREKLPAFGFAEDLLPPPPPAPSVRPLPAPRRVSAVSTLHLVTFALGEERFALPVDRVKEVLRVGTILRVPQAPLHVRGIREVRGSVLPILELRTRLGLPEGVPSSSSRVVVVEGRGRKLGLYVDAVRQVLRIPEASVEVPPAEVRSRLSDHVIGVASVPDGLVLLLDLERLLYLPELES